MTDEILPNRPISISPKIVKLSQTSGDDTTKVMKKVITDIMMEEERQTKTTPWYFTRTYIANNKLEITTSIGGKIKALRYAIRNNISTVRSQIAGTLIWEQEPDWRGQNINTHETFKFNIILNTKNEYGYPSAMMFYNVEVFNVNDDKKPWLAEYMMGWHPKENI